MDRRIVIDRERIDELSGRFSSHMGHGPAPEELERLVSNDVDEEILYREAIARGLLETDGGVKTRLIQKMVFLEENAESRDPRELLERARELGLDRGDLVVRRILVQKMKLLGSALRPGQRPSEKEIADAYALEAEGFREPDRRSFVHVFFASKSAGDDRLDDARAVLEEIRSRASRPESATEFGEPFPLGSRFEHQSLRDLDRRFGMAFAKEAFAAPLHQWSKPIASAYGRHLIWIESIEPGRTRPYEAVRDDIRHRLERRIRARNLEAFLEGLRTRYEFVIADDREASAS